MPAVFGDRNRSDEVNWMGRFRQGNRAKKFWTLRESSESLKPLIRQSEDCGAEFG
jgi:hypothetical protein